MKVYLLKDDDDGTGYTGRYYGAFSTEGAAAAFRNGRPDMEIEAMELDALAVRRFLPNWRVWVCLKDGRMQGPMMGYDGQIAEEPGRIKDVVGNVYDGYFLGEKTKVILVKSFRSAEHAVELATEARRAWLHNQGGQLPTQGEAMGC